MTYLPNSFILTTYAYIMHTYKALVFMFNHFIYCLNTKFLRNLFLTGFGNVNTTINLWLWTRITRIFPEIIENSGLEQRNPQCQSFRVFCLTLERQYNDWKTIRSTISFYHLAHQHNTILYDWHKLKSSDCMWLSGNNCWNGCKFKMKFIEETGRQIQNSVQKLQQSEVRRSANISSRIKSQNHKWDTNNVRTRITIHK